MRDKIKRRAFKFLFACADAVNRSKAKMLFPILQTLSGRRLTWLGSMRRPAVIRRFPLAAGVCFPPPPHCGWCFPDRRSYFVFLFSWRFVVRSVATLQLSILRRCICPRARAGDVQADAINSRLRGEIQRAVVGIAPVEVVRLLRAVQRAEQFTRRRKDP